MSDLAALQASADAYLPNPPGTVVDGPGDTQAVITDVSPGHIRVAVRGTKPELLANLLEDIRINNMMLTDHPMLGPVPAGPAGAADALWAALAPHLAGVAIEWTGHSLGGQMAALMAAIAILELEDAAFDGLVTWDAPKAGTDTLAAAFAGLRVRQYRFRGSPVTAWPLALDRHIVPLVDIGVAPTLIPGVDNWLEAHSVERALDWAREQWGT